jgi:hypothetical protein
MRVIFDIYRYVMLAKSRESVNCEIGWRAYYRKIERQVKVLIKNKNLAIFFIFPCSKTFLLLSQKIQLLVKYYAIFE